LNHIGYKSQDQLFETDYYNMPCKASENAQALESEDKIALSQEIKILSYHHFDNGWKILLGHKKPIISNVIVIGTLANFIDISHSNIVDISRFLLETNHEVRKKQFSLIIQDSDEICGLTRKEQACLFYLMRGYSYGEIAKALLPLQLFKLILSILSKN
jgi:hypothetical protein